LFNLGPLELFAIFIVALLVFGPNKLPEIGRQVGRAVREFRRIQSSFQNDFRDVFEEAAPGPLVPGPAPAPTQGSSDSGPATTAPASDGDKPDTASAETQSGESGAGSTEGDAPEPTSR
jgi:TatA/E family protein of Tat protein translocase